MEKKISKVSSRVTELEILMSVFEAKLNSIPATGVEYRAEQLPDAAPPPPPHSSDQPTPPAPTATAAELAPDPEPATAPTGPMVKDHPEYSKYFKMLKVGVPQVVVQGKMSENGLDPAYLETPDAPAPGGGDDADTGGDAGADID